MPAQALENSPIGEASEFYVQLREVPGTRALQRRRRATGGVEQPPIGQRIVHR